MSEIKMEHKTILEQIVPILRRHDRGEETTEEEIAIVKSWPDELVLCAMFPQHAEWIKSL